MSRRCQITGVDVQSGNNVSHSCRHTRRRFLPNIQSLSFTSEVLGRDVRLKITASALRTINHNGGFDSYILATSNLKLAPEALKLKKAMLKSLKAKGKDAKDFIAKPSSRGEVNEKSQARRKAKSALALVREKKKASA